MVSQTLIFFNRSCNKCLFYLYYMFFLQLVESANNILLQVHFLTVRYFIDFHVYENVNALFYCSLINKIRLLHISVLGLGITWFGVCVCQSQRGGGVGGASAVTVYHFRRSERFLLFFKKKTALLRPVTSAARISPASPCFPQHGDPHSDSAAPRWCIAIKSFTLWTSDQAAERTHGGAQHLFSPSQTKVSRILWSFRCLEGKIKKCAVVMLELFKECSCRVLFLQFNL